MFKKSDLFYFTAERYQNDRNAREDMFNKDMKSIESYKGDKYYEERAAQFRKQYEADMTPMKAAAKRELSGILEEMRKNAEKTPSVMPSTEQVNMLTLLNMRDHLTQRDVDDAAKMMSNCPAALKTLDEIAEKKSTRTNPLTGVAYRFAPAMSVEKAMELLEGSNNIEDFLQHNSSRASRVAAKSNEIHYGTKAQLTRRKTFDNKAACFGELFGIDGEAYEKFVEMVDAD